MESSKTNTYQAGPVSEHGARARACVCVCVCVSGGINVTVTWFKDHGGVGPVLPALKQTHIEVKSLNGSAVR